MWPFNRLFPLLVAACFLPGCGSFKKKEPPKPDGPKTELIGIVEMVNPEQNYVLIRCEQNPSFGAGTELVALDATGAESKLKLTPERKGRYLTADIQSGQPKVMNLVLRRTSGNAPLNTPPAPAPIAPPGVAPTLPLIPTLPAFSLEQVNSQQVPLAPASPAAEVPAAPAVELEPAVQ